MMSFFGFIDLLQLLQGNTMLASLARFSGISRYGPGKLACRITIYHHRLLSTDVINCDCSRYRYTRSDIESSSTLAATSNSEERHPAILGGCAYLTRCESTGYAHYLAYSGI